MEAGSLDGDSAADVTGFHGFGSVLGEKDLGTSILITEPGSMEACSLDAPSLDFEWISSILFDLGWICVHFLDSRGPGSAWRPGSMEACSLDAPRLDFE